MADTTITKFHLYTSYCMLWEECKCFWVVEWYCKFTIKIFIKNSEQCSLGTFTKYVFPYGNTGRIKVYGNFNILRKISRPMRGRLSSQKMTNKDSFIREKRNAIRDSQGTVGGTHALHGSKVTPANFLRWKVSTVTGETASPACYSPGMF